MPNLEGMFCWEDDHGCICGNGCAHPDAEHKWHTPDCSPDCPGCMWCAGGLETCKNCGAFEGATPDECPGEPIPAELAEQIYKGKWNYRGGKWVAECAQVMRPVYDLENYMAENGYRPGPPHPISGNPTWEKI